MDKIIRVTAGNGSVRAFFADTKNTVNDAHKTHMTTPVVTAGLGRLLTASLMIGQTLKNDKDLITLMVKGDGPMRGLVATSSNKGTVKGYPYNNNVDIPLKPSGKLDVGTAVGHGTLTIIQDTGLKEPYNGSIPLISGEIADDLTYYYAKSEQIPTSVALGVLVDTDYSVKQAGGFIIQLLPNTEDEVINTIEKSLQQLPPLTSLLDKGKTIYEIAEIVLGDLGINVVDEIDVSYKCDCSVDRVEKALISVGLEELETILKEDKQTELNCHFCNKKYNFDEKHLTNLINNLKIQ